MDPKTPNTPSNEDDAQPFNKQHEYNFFLDRDIQKTLLAAGDVATDPEPTTSAPMGRLLDYDVHPWSSGPVRRTSSTNSSTSTTLSSAYLRTREPRVNYVTRHTTVNRSKEIPFRFHHYADPARYMEQYRRLYTYANLDTLKIDEDQFPVGLPPNADGRLPQTTPCQTGRTEVYGKRHTTSSVDFQDERFDLNPRSMRHSTSVDRVSWSLRNLGEFETSGPASTNKFWTFDANDVLPVVINTTGMGRTRRSLGGSTAGELVASSAAFSGKEAKHFPGNGYAMDDQSVKRLSSRVSNLQLPMAGLRAFDILTHTNHVRARLTQHRPLGVSTTLPVLR